MLILASQSPRRAEILRQAGIPFAVRAAPVDETPLAREQPADYVRRLAEAKADTTVVIDGEMLGKPADAADARGMLTKLSGRRHEVLTGICLRHGDECVVDHAVTAVWFLRISEREIAEYVESGEPMDKAGAYAIQGAASKFIPRVEGCYFNIVGLPVSLVSRHYLKLTR
jgi:septum formation protein